MNSKLNDLKSYLLEDERLISCDNKEFEDEVLMALICGSTAIRVSELKYFTEVGVDPHKVFPHSFRHLFALEHYNKNHDIEALARILGHKSTKTTEISSIFIDKNYYFDVIL